MRYFYQLNTPFLKNFVNVLAFLTKNGIMHQDDEKPEILSKSCEQHPNYQYGSNLKLKILLF